MNQTAQVIKFKAPKSVKKVSNASKRQMKQQLLAGAAVSVVALTLTGLSLNHLAHGINIVTNAPMWESWSMAMGIDLGFVALEMAQMSVTDKLLAKINCFTNPTIIGTMVGSAVLNAFAFSHGVTGWLMVPAIVLGLSIPAMIYAMTKVGAMMYRG